MSKSRRSKAATSGVNAAAGLLMLAAVVGLVGTGSAQAAGRNYVVEGERVGLELEVMPQEYQIHGGYALGCFTASTDSNFWCGPNKPTPFSWLTLSVICMIRCDFQVLLCTERGVLIETLALEDVEPATYRVRFAENKRPEPGFYQVRFRYRGDLVGEQKVHIKDAGSHGGHEALLRGPRN